MLTSVTNAQTITASLSRGNSKIKGLKLIFKKGLKLIFKKGIYCVNQSASNVRLYSENWSCPLLECLVRDRATSIATGSKLTNKYGSPHRCYNYQNSGHRAKGQFYTNELSALIQWSIHISQEHKL